MIGKLTNICEFGEKHKGTKIIGSMYCTNCTHMNQPPNTTEEKSKSKCCGAEKKWRKTSCTCKNESDQECYQIHHEKVCSKCYKPFVPTPSVCEVAKGECTHRQGHEEDHNGNCYFCGLNMLTPTEPKKTVENVCCQLGGFEHKIGLEYKGKVCTCTCHTPIQTGNDEKQTEWGIKRDNEEKLKHKEYSEAIYEEGLVNFVDNKVQKAVLQERESLKKLISERLEGFEDVTIEPQYEEYNKGYNQGLQVAIDLLDNKQ